MHYDICSQIHNFGYGTIKACFWNQFDGEERRICQQLDVHKEIILIDDFKCIDTRCPYIYLRVENATSLNKCAGNVYIIHSDNEI